MDNVHGRAIVERHAGDESVNAYCPFLLKFAQSNMDIQFNSGPRAINYIFKYISKATWYSRDMSQPVQRGNFKVRTPFSTREPP